MRAIFHNLSVILIASALLCPMHLYAGDSTSDDPDALPAVDSCQGDADCDGVPDEVESRVGTDPQKCDTDGDGLSDGVEAGFIQPVEKNGCHGQAAATSNDRGEAVGTNYRRPHDMNPLNPDSDGDGLKDGEEDKNANGWLDPDETDPSIEDTDGDGISDYVEATGDFDGDGFPDFDVSLINGGPRCNPPASIADPDCDGIPSARDDDSDGDGCPDKSEGGWIDSNSNSIPDIFDGQAKSCPEQASPATSTAKPKGPKEEEKGGAKLLTPFAGDAGDGGACALVRGDGHISRASMSLGPLLILAVGLALSFLKRGRLRRIS